MTEWVLQNPEIIRNIRARLRKGRVLGGIVIYLLLLLLIAYILYETMHHSFGSRSNGWSEYGKTLYFTLLGIEYFVSLVVGSVICAGSLVAERENHAYEFLKMLPLHPAKLVLGKLLGVPILVYLLIGLTLPVSLACVAVGSVSWPAFLLTHGLLLFAGWLTHSMGLFFSALAPKTAWASSGTLLFLFLSGIFLNIPPLVFLNPLHYFELAVSGKPLDRVGFFAFELPGFVLAIAVYLFFTVWFFIGIYRSLKQEGYRLLSKAQSIVFFALFSLLLTGLLWPHILGLSSESWLVFVALLSILLLLSTLLIFIMVPGYDDLMKWFHRHQLEPIQLGSHPLEDTKAIFPLLLFYTLIVAGLLGFMLVALPMWSRWPMVLWSLVFFTLFSMVYALLIQILHTWHSPFNRNYLSTCIIILSWGIPVFGGEPGVFFLFNPFFLLGYVAQQKPFTSLLFISLVALVALWIGLMVWYRTRLTVMRAKAAQRHARLEAQP